MECLSLAPMGVILGLQLCSITALGATVSWVAGSGDWNTANNWSTGVLPGTNDDVLIGSGPPIAVTHSSGRHIVRSLVSQQAFQLTGGSLTVSHTVQVDNTFTLAGGTLAQATVLQGTNGGVLAVQGNGALDGVALNGVLDVGNSFSQTGLTVTNGLILNGTAYVGNPTNGSSGAILFAGNEVLGGNGTVVFGNASFPPNDLSGANSGTTLVIGSGVTVRGQSGIIGPSSYWGVPANVSVVNQGSISADVPGGGITISAQPFSNSGLVQSAAGGINLAGTLTTAALGDLQSGGTGLLALSGVLTNSGQTLVLNGTTNNLTLAGGTILGGSIKTANGESLVVYGSGRLDGVTLNGVLDVGNSFSQTGLTVTNGLILNGTAYVGNPTNGSSGAILFAGNEVLGGNGTVVFGNASFPPNDLSGANSGTTLVIGSGVTVRGQNGIIGSSSYWGVPANVSVVNQGTISADVTGGAISIAGGSFDNTGLLRKANEGVMTILANTTNTGTVEVDRGSLTFSGSFSQTTGLLEFGLNALADFGQINLTRSAIVGGTLGALLGAGYLPKVGDSFAVLSCSTNSVWFASANFPLGYLWQTNYSNGILTLSVAGILSGAVTLQAELETTNGRPIIVIRGGQVGATFSVQSTEDLELWTTIGSVVKSQDVETFIDPSLTLPTQRFYRVRIN